MFPVVTGILLYYNRNISVQTGALNGGNHESKK